MWILGLYSYFQMRSVSLIIIPHIGMYSGFSIRAGNWRNSPAISRELAAYFSLEVIPPKKPKFNDACVLFKHSNFCSRMLEMHSKRPRFQNFPMGHAA